ncbi:hypothetical protein LSAT2_029998 [Lamellibrachia satsuma]|nr:hypothetical protein LSAT2_029998 [Lamellibrachia satsuma]
MEESGIVECFAKLDLGTPDTDNQPDVDAAVSGQQRECKNPAEETPICYTDTSDTENLGLQKEPSHVDSLIRLCVHAAGAILKDPEDMKERKTERVQLLLQLLKPKKPGEHELCFIDVLRKRMSSAAETQGGEGHGGEIWRGDG